jgi:hypothetical protein
MLNNHEANLTDEEAAAEVARAAKTYPVVRLLSADQIKSEPNCLLAGDRCPCLRRRVLRPWQIRVRCRSNCSTMVLSTAPVCAL